MQNFAKDINTHSLASFIFSLAVKKGQLSLEVFLRETVTIPCLVCEGDQLHNNYECTYKEAMLQHFAL